jgi:DNA-binding LytR/AlgR family response regulator
MKVIIEDLGANEEEICIIRTKSVTDNIVRAVNLLKCPDSLTVYGDSGAVLLDISDIYYAESVDLKTFVCGEKEVYSSKLRLYEIEEILSSGDFLRVSKQTIVSVQKIREISPAGGGRFQAELKNGEKIIIARSYVPSLKRRFGIK